MKTLKRINGKCVFLTICLILFLSIYSISSAETANSQLQKGGNYLDLTGYGGGTDRPRIENMKDNIAETSEVTHSIEFDIFIDKIEKKTEIEDDGAYYMFSTNGCSFTTSLGRPKLPILNERVMIPENAANFRIEIRSSDYTELAGCLIYPVPEQVVTVSPEGYYKVEEKFVKDANAYDVDSFYPEAGILAKVGEEIWWRGFHGMTVDIYPVQYNPKKNITRVYSHFKIAVYYELSGARSTYTSGAINGKPRCRGAFDKVCQNIFINPDAARTGNIDTKECATMTSGGSVAWPGNLLDPSNTADYLIITADDFYTSSALNDFADHRANHSNLNIAIVQLSAIYSQFPKDPGHEDESIKDFLKMAYSTWSGSVQYLLLVGDADDGCQSQGWFLPAHSMGSYVTDNWYGCLSDPTWMPELMIGRFPAQTEDELAAMTTKTIAFDNDTSPENGWGNKRLLSCGLIPERYIWLKYGFENIKSLCINDELKSEIDELYAEEPGYAGSVYNALNEGDRLFVCHSGHGSVRGWQNFTGTPFPNLTNEHKYIIFNHSCLTGRFNYPFNYPPYGTNCMGEVFMKNADGGAVAFFGASNTCAGVDSWQTYAFEIMTADNSYILGSVILNLKIRHAGQSDVLHIYNLLGDPALDFSHLLGSGSDKPEPQIDSFTVEEFDSNVVARPISGANFSITVTNRGISPISDLKLGLYKQNADASETKIADLDAGDLSGCNDAGGSTNTLSYRWDNPPEGTYEVILRVDPSNAIDELYDRNINKCRIQNIPYTVTVTRLIEDYNFTGGNFSFSGDNVVWLDNADIQWFDLKTGSSYTVPRPAGVYYRYFSVDQNTIFAKCDGHKCAVYDIKTGELYFFELGATNSYGEVLSGNNLAYVADNAGNYEIFKRSLASGECDMIAQENKYIGPLDISENLIVWMANGRIHYHDLSSGSDGEFTKHYVGMERLAVSGDKIVTKEYDYNNTYITMHDLSATEYRVVSSGFSRCPDWPDIWGDNVIFSEHRNLRRELFLRMMPGDYEIYIAPNSGTAKIYKNRIIWQSGNDVYMAIMNRLPRIEAIPTQQVTEQNPLTLNVRASDPDGDTLSFPQPPALPVEATFTDNGDGTAVLNWTPGHDQIGEYQVVFTATDESGLSDSKTATINVNEVNLPPVIETIPPQWAVAGEPFPPLIVNATDPDGDAIVYSASGLPAGAAFDQGTHTLTWNNPPYWQVLGKSNTYRVTFKASDGSLEASQVVTITVARKPQTPKNLTASPLSTSMIMLTWKTDPKGAFGSEINIERSIDGSSWSQVDNAHLVWSMSTLYAGGAKNKDLDENTKYYYRIRFVKGSLNSGYSNTTSAVTKKGPAAPSNLTAIGKDYYITLTWQDNSPDTRIFRVEKSEDGQNFNANGSDIPAYLSKPRVPWTMSCGDYDARPNKTYYYRIYAQYKDGSFRYSNIASANRR